MAEIQELASQDLLQIVEPEIATGIYSTIENNQNSQ